MVRSWIFFKKTKPITALALYLFFLPFFLLGCWHLGRGLGQIIQSHKRQVNFEEAAKLMGHWFVKNQTPQGDFLYELDISTGKPLEGYNIVRQAGSLYSLAQLYSYAHNQQIKTTLHQGFAFFEQLSQPQSPQTTAVVYQDTKKSNASALLLLALIEYLETHPEDRDQYFSWAQELAQYLLTTQKENGGFIYKPEISQEESAYNNGESFYALIKMYHLDPQPEYLEAVNRAANYFLKTYPANNQNYSFYAWGMAGFAHLYRIDPQERYWEYLKNSTYEFIETKETSQKAFIRGNWGVFLEGIIHAAWIAKSVDPQTYRYFKNYSETRLLQVLTLQIEGPYGKYLARFPNLKGGICYDQACQTQRIDIVHHNLSAVLLYLKLLK